MINPYFAERYTEERKAEILQEAKLNRLTKEARSNKPRFAGRLLLSLGQWLISWGSKWQERPESDRSLQEEL